jgi:TonB-dependent SusC/RagA subfamily outer membrane receptor
MRHERFHVLLTVPDDADDEELVVVVRDGGRPVDVPHSSAEQMHSRAQLHELPDSLLRLTPESYPSHVQGVGVGISVVAGAGVRICETWWKSGHWRPRDADIVSDARNSTLPPTASVRDRVTAASTNRVLSGPLHTSSKEAAMRTSGNRTAQNLIGILALATATSACAPLGAYRQPSSDDSAGTTAARTRTSSDSRVDHDQANQSYAHIEELIEGRAPGVRVLHGQDGSFRLQIRGVSSPAGRNDPLVVIDGTPATEFRHGSALASLNPQDVVRIDVLKDAASTAFYGMRGANGVIVITTRQHQISEVGTRLAVRLSSRPGASCIRSPPS